VRSNPSPTYFGTFGEILEPIVFFRGKDAPLVLRKWQQQHHGEKVGTKDQSRHLQPARRRQGCAEASRRVSRAPPAEGLAGSRGPASPVRLVTLPSIALVPLLVSCSGQLGRCEHLSTK
jgi:hypothetical protein